MDVLKELESLKRPHYECEDGWYSCPKSMAYLQLPILIRSVYTFFHEEGCLNKDEGDKCNCGADEANAKIDEIILELSKNGFKPLYNKTKK